MAQPDKMRGDYFAHLDFYERVLTSIKQIPDRVGMHRWPAMGTICRTPSMVDWPVDGEHQIDTDRRSSIA